MNRALDVAVAGIGLVIASPLIGVAALATKLEDRGPVVYRQTRVGKDGVDFVPFQVDDDSGIGVQVVAADVNGDKYPDIIVGNKKGIFVHIGDAKKVSKEDYEKQLPKPVGKN